MINMKISEVKRTASYSKTLQSMEVGETRSFEMIGTFYQGMNTARCRLREKGLTFTFKADSEKNLMHITRIS